MNNQPVKAKQALFLAFIATIGSGIFKIGGSLFISDGFQVVGMICYILGFMAVIRERKSEEATNNWIILGLVTTAWLIMTATLN